MTFSFGDVTVTTWRVIDGEQVWRARTDGGDVWEFGAPRDAPVEVLYAEAMANRPAT